MADKTVADLSNELEQLYQRIVATQGALITLQQNLLRNNPAVEALEIQWATVQQIIELLPQPPVLP
jgi:hypothetical protein